MIPTLNFFSVSKNNNIFVLIKTFHHLNWFNFFFSGGKAMHAEDNESVESVDCGFSSYEGKVKHV